MHIFWDIPDLGFHISIFMPKILGNSSDKNNKSCRIFHNGSNKTRFAFFVFFYDFIWILQDLANHIYYLRIKLRSGPWNFPTSHICPRFTKTTSGKIEEPAIGSLGQTAGGPCPIPARWRPGSVGRGWERPCVSPSGRFAPVSQVWYAGGERAVEPDGGSRCGSKPREGAACPEQRAGVRTWVDAREGVGVLSRRRKRTEEEARQRPLMATGGGARWGGGVHSREETGGARFIDGRPLPRDVSARQGADRGNSAVRRHGQRGQGTVGARTGAWHAAGADSRGAPECVPASERR
jgi:hypothetical protein